MGLPGWQACPHCKSSLFHRFRTASGVEVCTNCGEKLPQPEPDRLADLERRVQDIENARAIDSVAAGIKTERTAAWMGLPAILDRLKALEDKASYYHHIPVGSTEVPSLYDRIAELEAWRLRQTKGRQR